MTPAPQTQTTAAPETTTPLPVTSEPEPASAATNVGPELTLRLTAAERRRCLQAPLSPSATELPELKGHRHAVEGDNGERHVFFPVANDGKRPARGAANGVAEALRAQFPGLEFSTVRECERSTRDRQKYAAQCAYVEVPICEPWLPKAEAILEALAPQALGLVVDIVGRVGPRCIGDDCKPVGYHDDTPRRDDLTWSGWFTLPYRAKDGRAPLMPELARGQCGGDGDCQPAGCGNHCEAWTEAPHGAGCPAYRQLDDAHCGCVANACTWFTQAPLLDVKAEVSVDGWQLATRRDARGLEDKSGDVVFRELFEGSWFRRQLERLQHEQNVVIPEAFDFDLLLDKRLRASRVVLSINGAPGPRWLSDVLQHLPVPVPNASREDEARRTPVRAKGRVRVATFGDDH